MTMVVSCAALQHVNTCRWIRERFRCFKPFLFYWPCICSLGEFARYKCPYYYYYYYLRTTWWDFVKEEVSAQPPRENALVWNNGRKLMEQCVWVCVMPSPQGWTYLKDNLSQLLPWILQTRWASWSPTNQQHSSRDIIKHFELKRQLQITANRI